AGAGDLGQPVQDRLGPVALDPDHDLVAVPDVQAHHGEDALGGDGCTVPLGDRGLAGRLGGGLDEQGRGAGVQPDLGLDFDAALCHSSLLSLCSGHSGARPLGPIPSQSTSVRWSTIRSAFCSTAGACVVVMATTLIPARSPASTPAGVSSKTVARAGSTPSIRAPARYPSGWGLPRRTSAAVITPLNSSATPTMCSAACAHSGPAEVTRAIGTPWPCRERTNSADSGSGRTGGRSGAAEICCSSLRSTSQETPGNRCGSSAMTSGPRRPMNRCRVASS